MNKMREHTKIILWIVVIAFIATIIFSWGMNYTGRGNKAQKGIIGTINGKDIPRDYFLNLLQDQYVRYREQYGQEPDRRVMKLLRDQIWENIVNSTLISEEIKRMGIKVSDEEVVFQLKNNPPDIIRNNPAFMTDNKFDIQKYYQAMRIQNPQVNMFWAQLESLVRSSLPTTKIQNLVVSTVRVTEDEIYSRFLEEEQTARVKYIYCGPERFIDNKIEISEKEMQDYYNSHIDEYKLPPQRKLRYVVFKTTPTKEDSIKIDETIKDVLKRAKAGEDFAELAKEYSMGPTAENGGDLGYFTKGTMIKEFEDAVFKAKVGEVFGPVKTPLGIHIIKVVDRKPPDSKKKGRKTRRKRRYAKTDSVRASHILFKYVASDNTIDNAKYDASNFAEIAKEEGFEKIAKEQSMEIKETPYFEKSGFIPGIGMMEDAISFAFRGKLNDISSAIKSPDGFYVFQIIDIQPERIKSFDEVKTSIEDILKIKKRKEMAGKLLSKVYDKITSGKSLSRVAKEDSLEVKKTDEFKLNDYINNIGRDIKFSSTAFKLKPGEISKPVEGLKGYYLIQLIEKSSVDTSLFKTRKEEIADKLLTEKQQLLFTQWISYLRSKADIKDYRSQIFGD